MSNFRFFKTNEAKQIVETYNNLMERLWSLKNQLSKANSKSSRSLLIQEIDKLQTSLNGSSLKDQIEVINLQLQNKEITECVSLEIDPEHSVAL